MDRVSCAEGVIITHPDLVDLEDCTIGAETRIGPFVEIRPGAQVGARCKVSSHAVICAGTRIEDGVFIGHGAVITDTCAPDEARAQAAQPSTICKGASIGSRATVLPGCVVGQGALVGAGAVVMQDIPAYAIAAGIPARVIGDVRTKAPPPASLEAGRQ